MCIHVEMEQLRGMEMNNRIYIDIEYRMQVMNYGNQRGFNPSEPLTLWQERYEHEVKRGNV